MAISRNDRAKQFQSFDALKGLREALEEKEKEIEKEDRKKLSEEMQEKISERLKTLHTGDNVKICYYNMEKYKVIVTKIKTVDKRNRLIRLTNGEEIKFVDIYNIEIF